MTAPTLVLAGDEDPIVKVSAGRRTARSIPDARFMILRGAGHDIPAPLWETVSQQVRANADRASRT